MYKVMVVDDEPKVRRGLAKLIPQLDNEWTVVGVAKNGNEALEILQKEMPDLVITDIRMPHMNGLDLLNAIKEYPVHVVILSGYGYFEYAQTAIKYGAFDYLLKPLKPDVIQDVLSRVKSERRSMAAEAQSGPDTPNYSRLWKDWLTGNQDEQEPPGLLDGFYSKPNSTFRILALEIDHFDDLITDDQWGDRQLVQFAVRNIFQDICLARQEAKSYFLFANGTQIYFLLVNDRQAVELAESLIENVNKWVKISTSIGLSNEANTFAEMPELWRNAREALQNKWIYGCGTVSDYGEFQMDDILGAGYPNHLDEQLTIALRSGRQEEAKACLSAFIVHVKEMNVPFKLFRRFCLQLTSNIIRITYELEIHDLVFKKFSRPFDLFEINFTSDEFLELMTDMIEACGVSLAWKRMQRHNRTIDKAVQYIRSHFTRDLSLEEVAGHVRMNTSYFSTFFKSETGGTFVEYVTSLRLEKAKALMMNPDLRLYEIAQMVGYQEVKYFSRIFKKKTGVTPAEYRQFFYQKEGLS